MSLLVETTSTSQGQQREHSTPQGKKQAHVEGIFILLALELVLI